MSAFVPSERASGNGAFLPDARPAKADVESLVFESDWLASRPFFYNVRTGAAGDNVNDVIDLANAEFDPEGLNDFLDFGFSVFERTPVRDVRMLRYSSRLYSGLRGLRVEYLDDPALEWLERESTVDEVLEVASAKVNAAAAATDGEVVVPTSGGLDSRLINALLTDRRRVRAFTYGINDHPQRSFETVKAKVVAERLGIRWELISLGQFHRYFDEWDAQFGISTHAHGMYQIEFYRAVCPRVAPASLLLSGASGDRFAGSDTSLQKRWRIDSIGDVFSVFGWGHSADSGRSRFKSERVGALRLLEDEPRMRDEKLPRTLAAERLRMPYLSYLRTVPASLGLRLHAPFADIDLAMRMLTLPAQLRDGRRWQHEFFARQGLDIESEPLRLDFRNTLNFRGMRLVPLQPLDADLLGEVVEPEYVRWVNRWVGPLGLSSEALYRLGWVPGFRRAVEALRPTGWQGLRLRAYGAYLTLKPIEAFLRRRERARCGENVGSGAVGPGAMV